MRYRNKLLQIRYELDSVIRNYMLLTSIGIHTYFPMKRFSIEIGHFILIISNFCSRVNDIKFDTPGPD